MINSPHFLADKLAHVLFDFADVLPDPDQQTMREAIRALREIPPGTWEVMTVRQTLLRDPEKPIGDQVLDTLTDIVRSLWLHGRFEWEPTIGGRMPSRTARVGLTVMVRYPTTPVPMTEKYYGTVKKSGNELECEVDNSDNEK